MSIPNIKCLLFGHYWMIEVTTSKKGDQRTSAFADHWECFRCNARKPYRGEAV